MRIGYFFRQRLSLLRNMYAEHKWFYSVVAVFVVMLLVACAVGLTVPQQIAGVSVLLIAVHARRGDREFLQSVAKGYAKLFMALDYVFIALPFCAVTLCRGNYVVVLFSLALSFVLPYINKVELPVGGFNAPSLFRRGSYEYEKGFRTSFLIYAILILSSIIGRCYDNLNMPKAFALLYFILCLPLFFDITSRRDYMMHYTSVKRMAVMTFSNIALNTLALIVPLGVVLATSDFIFILTLYAASCLSTFEMAMLRFSINGDVLLSAFAVFAVALLGAAAVFNPRFIPILIFANAAILFFSLDIIKKAIYGDYKQSYETI